MKLHGSIKPTVGKQSVKNGISDKTIVFQFWAVKRSYGPAYIFVKHTVFFLFFFFTRVASLLPTDLRVSRKIN